MNKKNLIWIDLEMTGLNPEIHRIIEIAILITDSQLNIILEGPVVAIHQKKKHITSMDTWNNNIHTQTGLIERVQKSKYDEIKAESKIVSFLKKTVPIHSSPMCGNSIYQDRIFLRKYMPILEDYFHYRCIDVSTIKELVSRWHPALKKKKKIIQREKTFMNL